MKAQNRQRLLRTLLWSSLLVPLAEIVYPGCATLVNGPAVGVHIRSNPPHARLYVNGRLEGEAPLTIHLLRWGFHSLRLELDGFEPAEIPLNKTTNGAVDENVFIGIAPVVIDLLTGAVFDLHTSKEFEDHEAPLSGVFGSPNLYVLAELHPVHHGRQIAQLRRKQP